MPVLAKGKTDTGRIWVYVEDDKPFGGPAPPGAVFLLATGPASVAGAPGRFTRMYPRRMPMTAMASFTSRVAGLDRSWKSGLLRFHARRPFFVMADLAEHPRKAQGKKPAVISPLALEAVRRIDELFEMERAINRTKP